MLASGAYAANLLGLTEQVPSKIVYLTEGAPKRVRIGQQEIIFKKTTPKNIAPANTFAGLVFQAFKHLGKDQVNDQILGKLKKRLNKEEADSLRKYSRFAPAWIQRQTSRLLSKAGHG